MDVVLLILFGIIGGAFGGSGMGGGTFLIPLLTIFLGVGQKIAQGINLIAFLPMAIIAIIIHIKNKLIKKDSIFFVIIPGVIFSVVGSVLSALVDKKILSTIFACFLIVISIYQFFDYFKKRNN